MKKYMPYMNYFKRIFKIYSLTIIGMLAFVIVATIFTAKIIGISGDRHVISGISGSMIGVVAAYGAMASYTGFNDLVSIRADRRKAIISILIGSVLFAVITAVLYAIMSLLFSYIMTAIFGDSVSVVFSMRDGSDNIAITIAKLFVIALWSAVFGNFFGSVLYRFGIARVIIFIMLILALVFTAYYLYPDSMLYVLIRASIFFDSTLNVVIVGILNLVILETIFVLLMRKAPVLSYAKGSFRKVLKRGN